jgi:hypothetical protein
MAIPSGLPHALVANSLSRAQRRQSHLSIEVKRQACRAVVWQADILVSVRRTGMRSQGNERRMMLLATKGIFNSTRLICSTFITL